MSLKRSEVYIAISASVLILAVLLIVSFFSNESLTGHATVDSQVGNLSADVQTYVACTWSAASLAVDFGSLLNPGTDDINATENDMLSPGTGYNVTVDSLTTSNVNITISGNDLADGGNVIAVGNITWAANETDSDGINLVPGSSTSLTSSDVNLASDIAPDNTAHYRFWLDIPSQIVAGNYEGNYTMTCEEA